LVAVRTRRFRYCYLGIGRFEADAAMARGLADLANLIQRQGYVHGDRPTTIAPIYGFVANIYFYDIETPLREFVVSHDGLAKHCRTVRAAVSMRGWNKIKPPVPHRAPAPKPGLPKWHTVDIASFRTVGTSLVAKHRGPFPYLTISRYDARRGAIEVAGFHYAC
jgi:hypothetical protein